MSSTKNNNIGQQLSVASTRDDCDFISDDEIIGLVPYGFHSDSDDSSSEFDFKTIASKHTVIVEKSLEAKNNKCRERSKTYSKNLSTVKERCSCKRNITMKCAQITDDERHQIFTEFWKMDWKGKKVYVKNLVEITKISRPRNRKIDCESRRSRTLQYFLRVEDKNIRVCKTFFLNTLNIGRQAVFNWMKKPLF